MMKKLVIYGAGTHTRQFLSEVERYGAADPVALTVDREYLEEERKWGLPVVAYEDCAALYPPESFDMLVIGSYGRMKLRDQMYQKATAGKYRLINYISPKAYIDAEPMMGNNNIIYAGAEVGFAGQMGSDNIVRQQVYLGHEFRIGNHNVISPGCTIGGNLQLGDRCWIGLGARIRDQISIGDDCLIGMGAAVVRNVESYAVVMGVPGKVVSWQRETGVDLSRKVDLRPAAPNDVPAKEGT